MSVFWRRTAGIFLLIGALLGVVLSIGGLYVTWAEMPRIEAKIGSLIDLATRSLDTTQAGLMVINSSLDQSRLSIQTMETTAAEIGTSIDQTVPMVHSTAGLIGDDVTGIVNRTQSSIASAQTSARFVDDTLNLINSLPLIGKRYGNGSSLSQSLSEISTSLDGLPSSLDELKSNLNISADNLQKMRDRVYDLSSNIQQMDASIGEAQDVVKRYQAQVSELQVDAARAKESYPTWIQVAKWGATLFFLWLAAAQIGLALQGVGMLYSAETIRPTAASVETPAAIEPGPEQEGDATG